MDEDILYNGHQYDNESNSDIDLQQQQVHYYTPILNEEAHGPSQSVNIYDHHDYLHQNILTCVLPIKLKLEKMKKKRRKV